MANNDSPKIVRTEAQMFPLVESWLQSKLTQKQFSEQHGLALHILPYWVNRYRQVHPDSSPAPMSQSAQTPAFIQIDPAPAIPCPSPPPTTPPIAPPTEMAIELPSGLVLRFSSLIPVSYLQEVVGICSR